MTRYLIINGDDLGLSPGVNRGILEAHERGVLSSASVMINMPDAAAGIALLQREAPAVGIGLHVNLTTGRPVLPAERVPSLVQGDGAFGYVAADPLHHVESFVPGEVAAEIEAQVDRFVELAGRLPDHLDSHHHAAYYFVAGLRALLDLADAHGIPVRRGCEWTADPAAVGPRFDELRRLLAARPPRWPDHLEQGFYDEGATLDNLLALLRALPPGVSELMTHPGHDDGFRQVYAAQREREIAVLTDPEVRAFLGEEGIEIVTFAAVRSAARDERGDA